MHKPMKPGESGNKTNLLRLLVFFSFFFVREVFAQDIYYQQLGMETGLPSNEIYSLAKDPEGFVWMGSNAGLHRYNGFEFVGYKNPKLRSTALNALVCAGGKTFACSFGGQLVFVENDSMRVLEQEFKIIRSLCKDQLDNLWIGSDIGLFYLNTRDLSIKKYDDFNNDAKPDPAPFAKSCVVDEQNNLYCITASGIAKLSNAKIQLYPIVTEDKMELKEFFVRVWRGKPWVITQLHGYFFRFDGAAFVRFENELTRFLEDKKITTVLLSQKDLVICTYNGLIMVKDESWKFDCFLEEYACSYLLVDNSEYQWIATLHSGLLIAPNKEIKSYSRLSSSVGQKTITKVFVTEDGLYFSNLSKQVGKVQGNDIQYFELESKADVLMFYEDKKTGTVYFNANSKLYANVGNRFYQMKPNYNSIKSMCRIGSNFVLATSQGLHFYKDLNVEHFDTLSNKWSRDLVFDSLSNLLYVATNKGLDVFEYKDSALKFKQSLDTNKQVIALVANYTEQGFVLYALYYNGKVLELSGNMGPRELCSMPENVQAVSMRLSNSSLYFATNQGLWQFEMNERKLQNSSKLMGILEQNILSVAVGRERVFFSTANGIVSIPTGLKMNLKPPSLKLKTVYIQKEKQAWAEEFSLKYQQLLSIELESSTFSKHLSLAYRIAESEANWTLLNSSSNLLEFPVLPSGDFELELALVNKENGLFSDVKRIKLHVSPPFWKSNVFYFLSLFMVSLLAFLVYKWRLATVKRTEAIKYQQIALKNEVRVAQLSSLSSQMSPHFLFNVLNSIKGFIYENDKKNAVKYLNEFSNLVRKTLQMSTVTRVSLAEELELLKVYVGLEAMLLEGDFEWELTLDPAIDAQEIMIPSLLVQPFVENAFKHGLRHSVLPKRLLIEVGAWESGIYLLIEDNGIGREASRKINASRLDHQSFASNAIEKRIQLINQSETDQLRLQVKDLYNEESAPCGTRIYLYIKVNEKHD